MCYLFCGVIIIVATVQKFTFLSTVDCVRASRGVGSLNYKVMPDQGVGADVDGNPLNSTKHNYTLTISPGEFPSMVEAYGGFLSITV